MQLMMLLGESEGRGGEHSPRRGATIALVLQLIVCCSEPVATSISDGSPISATSIPLPTLVGQLNIPDPAAEAPFYIIDDEGPAGTRRVWLLDVERSEFRAMEQPDHLVRTDSTDSDSSLICLTGAIEGQGHALMVWEPTGTLKWTRTMSESAGCVVVDGTVVIEVNGVLQRFDASGSALSEVPLSADGEAVVGPVMRTQSKVVTPIITYSAGGSVSVTAKTATFGFVFPSTDDLSYVWLHQELLWEDKLVLVTKRRCKDPELAPWVEACEAWVIDLAQPATPTTPISTLRGLVQCQHWIPDAAGLSGYLVPPYFDGQKTLPARIALLDQKSELTGNEIVIPAWNTSTPNETVVTLPSSNGIAWIGVGASLHFGSTSFAPAGCSDTPAPNESVCIRGQQGCYPTECTGNSEFDPLCHAFSISGPGLACQSQDPAGPWFAGYCSVE